MNLAYLYPGQGSQSIGMVAELASSYPIVRQIFEQGSDILKQNLWDIAKNGPEEMLNRTANTQPLILCASISISKIWASEIAAKSIMSAGHSFGEYSALVAAGSVDFETAVAIAKFRGTIMQEAVPVGQGAMAAILGLDDEQLLQACEQSAQGQVVQQVNFNAPGQTVIAGDAEAVNRAVESAKSAGAKRAVILPLSVPSHSSLMKPAAEKLHEYLNTVTFTPSQIEVIQNVDVNAYASDVEIKDALYRQLFNPVRWVETIQTLIEQGISAFVELGPGKVLTGLCKRINRNVPCYCVHDLKSLEIAIESIEKFTHEVVE